MKPFTLEWWLDIWLVSENRFKNVFYDHQSSNEEVERYYKLKEWIRKRIIHKYAYLDLAK